MASRNGLILGFFLILIFSCRTTSERDATPAGWGKCNNGERIFVNFRSVYFGEEGYVVQSHPEGVAFNPKPMMLWDWPDLNIGEEEYTQLVWPNNPNNPVDKTGLNYWHVNSQGPDVQVMTLIRKYKNRSGICTYKAKVAQDRQTQLSQVITGTPSPSLSYFNNSEVEENLTNETGKLIIKTHFNQNHMPTRDHDFLFGKLYISGQLIGTSNLTNTGADYANLQFSLSHDLSNTQMFDVDVCLMSSDSDLGDDVIKECFETKGLKTKTNLSKN